MTLTLLYFYSTITSFIYHVFRVQLRFYGEMAEILYIHLSVAQAQNQSRVQYLRYLHVMILFLSDVYNYKKSGQAASRTKLFLKMCTSGQVLAWTVHFSIISTSPSLYAILLSQVEFVLVQTFDNYLTFFCYFSSVAPVVHDELTAPTPDAQALIAVTPALKSKLSDLEKEIERLTNLVLELKNHKEQLEVF